MTFTHAIVRPPASTFARGLTSATLGPPDVERARAQHRDYCAALVACGLEVTALEPDDEFPDSTFVEDVAVVTARGAMLTRPGAPARQGETARIRAPLTALFPKIVHIEPPGTLDGGDVCEANGLFFIGISHRTNEAGAAQLQAWLAAVGYASAPVDIRYLSDVLHLKSEMAVIGTDTIVATDALAAHPAFAGYRVVRATERERYAANCIDVNGTILVPAGFPRLAAALEKLGHPTRALEMSEFQKMDGGLSCLSLRF